MPLIIKNQERLVKLKVLQKFILDGYNSGGFSELDIKEIKKIARTKIKEQDVKSEDM